MTDTLKDIDEAIDDEIALHLDAITTGNLQEAEYSKIKLKGLRHYRDAQEKKAKLQKAKDEGRYMQSETIDGVKTGLVAPDKSDIKTLVAQDDSDISYAQGGEVDEHLAVIYDRGLEWLKKIETQANATGNAAPTAFGNVRHALIVAKMNKSAALTRKQDVDVEMLKFRKVHEHFNKDGEREENWDEAMSYITKHYHLTPREESE